MPHSRPTRRAHFERQQRRLYRTRCTHLALPSDPSVLYHRTALQAVLVNLSLWYLFNADRFLLCGGSKRAQNCAEWRCARQTVAVVIGRRGGAVMPPGTNDRGFIRPRFQVAIRVIPEETVALRINNIGGIGGGEFRNAIGGQNPPKP